MLTCKSYASEPVETDLSRFTPQVELLTLLNHSSLALIYKRKKKARFG